MIFPGGRRGSRTRGRSLLSDDSVILGGKIYVETNKFEDFSPLFCPAMDMLHRIGLFFLWDRVWMALRRGRQPESGNSGFSGGERLCRGAGGVLCCGVQAGGFFAENGFLGIVLAGAAAAFDFAVCPRFLLGIFLLLSASGRDSAGGVFEGGFDYDSSQSDRFTRDSAHGVRGFEFLDSDSPGTVGGGAVQSFVFSFFSR